MTLTAHLERPRNTKAHPEVIHLARKEANKMAVKELGEKYRCNVCGNEVVVTKVGGGTLVRCGEEMEKIQG